jgi:uncharacterized protein (TIGR00725 family)
MRAQRPVIAVVGGSECSAEEAVLAEAVGRQLAAAGVVVLSGGLTGVMEAVARGVRAGGGLSIGILPGADPGAANRFVDVALATGMGEMRNALIVRAARAVIAIGGGAGTLSEVALALRIGTPVVGLHDRFPGVALPRVAAPEAAVAWALEQAGNRPV